MDFVTQPLLSTHVLKRQFGGLHAVDGVDFKVAPGEIRAIIGPNGAGKSTFVGMISGRVPVSSGDVFFEGEEITDCPCYERARLGIAYTFQITSVFSKLSAFDNVALSVQRYMTKYKIRSGPFLRSATLDALEKTGLLNRAGMVAGSLAYGHQRLLEVAMGLALKPRLLILDEPTQGLSDGEIDNFIGLVREISTSATVLLIEHNIPVVMSLADRITVLNFGKVLAEGTPDEIRSDYRVQEAYLGTAAHG